MLSLLVVLLSGSHHCLLCYCEAATAGSAVIMQEAPTACGVIVMQPLLVELLKGSPSLLCYCCEAATAGDVVIRKPPLLEVLL